MTKDIKKESNKEKVMGNNSNNDNNKEDRSLAAILIRGKIHFRHDVKETLQRLNLIRKNNCVILPDTLIVNGMLEKVKDAITWGTVSQETISKVSAKRAVKRDKVKFKSYALSPPRGGFDRKGIKKSYPVGGALGKRNNMDELLSRMV